MLKRKIMLPPEHLYPADEWRIVEVRYSDEFVGLTETVFSLGNGFVGVRGSLEEGRPALVPGTFVNGFHETWPIVHAEDAPALAKTGQTIVNVPDTTIIKLYVDDEPFFLPTARLQDYGRILDMRAGARTRELVWATGAGKHVRIRSCRMVSLEHRHLVAMTYEVTMLDEPAPVVVSSLVLNRQDARQTNDLPEYRPGDPRLATVLPHRVLNVRAAELGRYRATVNAVAPVARTRLTEWLGEAPASPGASPGDDPLAAEQMAPVIAWLLGPAARTVTGRVLEAGNGQISAPGTWQRGPQFPLPSLMSPEAADVLLPWVLASAAPPPEVLSSQS